MHFLKLAPAIVVLPLLLAAPALAGGTEKECGKDFPSGSYTETCRDPYWNSDTTMRAYCSKTDGRGTLNTPISCNKIQHCKWKLARDDDGRIICD